MFVEVKWVAKDSDKIGLDPVQAAVLDTYCRFGIIARVLVLTSLGAWHCIDPPYFGIHDQLTPAGYSVRASVRVTPWLITGSTFND